MSPSRKIQISIIIPLFNEEKVLPQLLNRLDKLCDNITYTIEIVLVDDGSTDNTSQIIEEKAKTNDGYQSIILSRNFGHQYALTAGMKYANGSEAILIIDGDLQDPPELLPELYKKLKEGYDVVYAIRKKRKENLSKKISYRLFYRLFKKISYINIPLDSGDFSMISRRAADILNEMPEENRFIRGMRSWIGFKQVGFEYERAERAAGNPKYTFKKLRKLAYSGIFNFSEIPIKFITKLGMAAFLLGFIYFGYTLFRKILYNDVPQGFTSLLFGIIFFSGVQLISIGILGEYILRIFYQVKNRPKFIVDKIIKNKEDIHGQELL